jgi:hypothetical protein
MIRGRFDWPASRRPLRAHGPRVAAGSRRPALRLQPLQGVWGFRARSVRAAPVRDAWMKVFGLFSRPCGRSWSGHAACHLWQQLARRGALALPRWGVARRGG